MLGLSRCSESQIHTHFQQFRKAKQSPMSRPVIKDTELRTKGVFWLLLSHINTSEMLCQIVLVSVTANWKRQLHATHQSKGEQQNMIWLFLSNLLDRDVAKAWTTQASRDHRFSQRLHQWPQSEGHIMLRCPKLCSWAHFPRGTVPVLWISK